MKYISNVFFGWLLVFFMSSTLTVYSADRALKLKLDYRLKEIMKNDPCSWSSFVLSVGSSRELIEECYFVETGKMLSLLSCDERREVFLEYMGDSYNVLSEYMREGFEREDSVEKKLKVASFMAFELLDSSLIEELEINFLELDRLSREDYLKAQGFVGNIHIGKLLEDQVYLVRGRAGRDKTKTVAKMKMLQSGMCIHNIYETQSAINIARENENSTTVDALDVRSALGCVQAMRYAKSSDLAFVVAEAGYAENPSFVLEVLKQAISFEEEEGLVKDLLLRYSAMERGLSIQEWRLIKWSCLAINRSKDVYRSDLIIGALGKLAKKDDRRSAIVEETLKEL